MIENIFQKKTVINWFGFKSLTQNLLYGIIINMKIKNFRPIRSVILILILALFLSLYFFFSAKKQSVTYFESINTNHIAYNNLIPSMNSTPTAYYFCTETNIDCRYIDNKMLDALVIDANVERFENILLVDTATMQNSILPSALKARLGFSDFPAFAVLSYENGFVVIHSVLQWSNSDPFTLLDLKDWMKENGLWLENYTN